MGPELAVEDVDVERVASYLQARRRGDPKLKNVVPHQPVRNRTIETDLAAVKAACPRRNVRTHPEFLRLLKKAPDVHEHLPLALIIAEGTGRRPEALRVLRWEDVRWAEEVIVWRADSDKMGYEVVQPMPEGSRSP